MAARPLLPSLVALLLAPVAAPAAHWHAAAAGSGGYTITPSAPALVHLVTKPGAQAKFPAMLKLT